MNPKERMKIKIKIKKWHENLIKNEFGTLLKTIGTLYVLKK